MTKPWDGAASGKRFEIMRALLNERFPKAFPGEAEPRPPLAVGIHKQIRDAMPDWANHDVFWFMRKWTERWRYLEALQAGAWRVDLEGKPVHQVAQKDQAHAQLILEKRAKKRAATAAIVARSAQTPRVVTPQRVYGQNPSPSNPGGQRRQPVHQPAQRRDSVEDSASPGEQLRRTG
jgi:sRNA-binding protein